MHAAVRTDRYKERVIRAAEWALSDHDYVSLIDLFTGINMLADVHVASWRKGGLETLGNEIQCGKEKFARSIELLYEWAKAQGLSLSEAKYVRSSPSGPIPLKFYKNGPPELERLFHLHFLSPDLSDRARQRIEEKQSRPDPPVVFQIITDSKCAKRETELEPGSLLLLEAKDPLCIDCAGMGDLEFLPSGDTGLTRRAGKYSSRSAVVVRFSKSRMRYERQGTLVEKAALEKATESLKTHKSKAWPHAGTTASIP